MKIIYYENESRTDDKWSPFGKCFELRNGETKHEEDMKRICPHCGMIMPLSGHCPDCE